MKVLFVSASLGLGGSEKCMAEMIRRMDLERCEVTILALMPGDNFHVFDNRVRVIKGLSEFETLNKPMSVFIQDRRNWCHVGLMASKLCFWLKVRRGKHHISHYFWETMSKYLKPYDEPFDVVIGYGQGFATYYTMDKVTVAGKKILWVNTDLEKAKYNIDNIRKYYLKADRIVADSENGVRNLCRLFPEKGNVIHCFPNLLDVNQIRQKAQKYRAEYTDSPDKRILTVARLVEAKAVHLAVGAAAILKERGYRFQWYIVGDGNLRCGLEAQMKQLQVEDCFSLVGARSNPYPWFAGCEIYVQTSIYEGSCMTINEALIFDKPVVTTNFPAAYEKVLNYKNGMISEMTAKSIAENIEKLLDSAVLCKEMEGYAHMHQIDYGEQMKLLYTFMEQGG